MSSRSTPLTGTGKPLTEANLRILDESSVASDMPPKANPDAETSTYGTESAYGNESTPVSTKLHDLNTAFWSNNLWMEDTAAKQRCPEVFEFASTLIKRKRHSDMDEASQRDACKTQQRVGLANEATFVREIWNHVHKTHRDKRISGEPGSDIVDAEWARGTWNQAHLGVKWDQEFESDMIPRLEPRDATTIRFLHSLPRIKDPRPNIAYGINETAFTLDEWKVMYMHRGCSQFSSGLCFPFLAAEFTENGSLTYAIFQACRSGASMVAAAREFNRVSGLERKDAGADMTSFAFTLAFYPHLARLNVHWAEVVPGEPTIYHMHRISSYALDVARSYQEIRHDLNNILDWGLSNRLKQAKERLNAIAKKNQSETQPSRKRKFSSEEESEKQDAELEDGSAG